MRKILYFLIPLSFFQLYAQSDSLINQTENSLNLFLLNSFSMGYDIALSSNSAINISGDISGYFNSDDIDSKSNYYGTSDTTFSKDSEEYSNIDNDFTLYVLYKNYFYIDQDFKCYFLIGPLIGYHNSKYERNNNSSSSENKRSGIFSGITFNPGFSYSLTERLSLLSEYRIKLTYSWDTEKYFSKSNTKRIENNDINRTSIQIQNLRVGISFKI